MLPLYLRPSVNKLTVVPMCRLVKVGSKHTFRQSNSVWTCLLWNNTKHPTCKDYTFEPNPSRQITKRIWIINYNTIMILYTFIIFLWHKRGNQELVNQSGKLHFCPSYIVNPPVWSDHVFWKLLLVDCRNKSENISHDTDCLFRSQYTSQCTNSTLWTLLQWELKSGVESSIHTKNKQTNKSFSHSMWHIQHSQRKQWNTASSE